MINLWLQNRRSRKDAEVTLRYLKTLHYAMEYRLGRGDMDIDDNVYRTREACETLIKLREPDWQQIEVQI